MATATTGPIAVAAKPREAKNKGTARRVRRAGMVPAILYGAGKEPISISVNPKEIAHIMQSAAGHNTIFDLNLDGGETTKAMIVDWQREPIKGSMLHVDMKRIAMDKKLIVKVPITLKGEPIGVKTEGGILEQVLREIEVECLPADIPSHFEVDVTELNTGQVIRVSDLPHGGTLHFLTDLEEPVAHIIYVKEEVVEPTPEAAAAAATEAPAEPEVIKKGKQETEEATPEAAEKKK